MSTPFTVQTADRAVEIKIADGSSTEVIALQANTGSHTFSVTDGRTISVREYEDGETVPESPWPPIGPEEEPDPELDL